MKKFSTILMAMALVVGLLPSCKKKNNQTTTASTPPFQIGQPITPGNLAKGSYKGTMTTGNTYNLQGDFTVNIGDTVFLQPGVTVCVGAGVTIIVKGTLISMGTQSQQNWFTACGVKAVDQVGNSVLTDPAYQGSWTGINCDTSCKLLDLQWTHVCYCGATFSTTEPFVGGTSGSTSFGILFQNPNGDIILTDSWIYGTVDDAARISNGRLYVARNTLEKMGYLGGDGINMKHGCQGDVAYNLCVGNATNSTKASDKGSGTMCQCNVNMYNNTYVDGGYRQASYLSRGSDIDYEQGARGWCYNNLIVNCRNGIRIGDGQNGIPMPDTTNTITLDNYIYADSIQEVDQFFPVQAGTWTRPNTYLIPTLASLNVPTPFYHPPYDDSAYSAPGTVATANNPMFVNFPLPENVTGYNLSAISSLETGVAVNGSNFNFHLSASSPAIGKGYTGFAPFVNILNPVIKDVTNPNFAATTTGPGADLGCYQTNGTGNQH
jgi:hypothetical protein